MLKDSTTQEERGVRMSKKRYEIVSYDIPLWLKPVLSVTETSIYTGISANKIYEMSESEDCPFVIWIGSRRVIKRKSFEAVFNIVKSQICDESDCIMGLSQKNEYTDAINTRRTKCKAKKKCH